MRRFDIARFMSTVQGGKYGRWVDGQMDRWTDGTQMVEDNIMGGWGEGGKGGRVLWSF